MMRARWVSFLASVVLVATGAGADNDTLADTCGPGLWGGLLEDWATSAPHGRQGRVMSLPPTKGYYVSDRMDLMPPPPPPHYQPHHGPYSGPPHGGHQHNGLSYNGAPPSGAATNFSHRGPGLAAPSNAPAQYDEWQASPPPPAGGKIVNKPPNPYKDKFRPSPSYVPPPPNQPIPLTPQQPQQQQWAQQPPQQSQQSQSQSQWADRVDAAAPPPQKQVSETDLYLLSAIEKLVYRVDLMEKRLRKMEETMHYIVVGKETKPEPCAGNFTRVGSGCYWVSAEAGDWKAASLRCRKLTAHLLELDSDDERRALNSALLADKRFKGVDFWTGGLNPGLLWIWAHSARPVLHNSTANTTSTVTSVSGDGRCLALVHDPALAAYVYRGQDCALRHRYVCELPEEKAKEKLSNDIERVARELASLGDNTRKARLGWTT